MDARFIIRCVLAAALLMTVFLPTHALAEGPLRVAIDERTSELTVFYKQQPVLVYAFSRKQPKPYIKQLHTLSGWDVLTDAPADHSHHHGVMYGVQVNGHNVWQEPPDGGIQQSVKIEDVDVTPATDGVFKAGFLHVINWLASYDRGSSDERKALVREKRRITVMVDHARSEVGVEWRSSFAVGDEKIVLTGEKYNGLGIRPARKFDLVAVHTNSERTLELRGIEQNLSRARWSAVSLNGLLRKATVALFGDPANARGTPMFFTMTDPFAYLSATQSLDTDPLEYAAGATFDLNFLVIATDMLKSKEYWNTRGGQWEEELRRDSASRKGPSSKK